MWKDIIEFINYNFINGENVKISLLDLMLLFLAITATSIVLKLIQKLFSKKLPVADKKKFNSVFQVVKYIVYLFVIVLMLNATGVNVNVFLTASAALFVGLGFALQTFFQDIISGVLIILDQSLHVGDIIEVDGRVGLVQEIKLRTTIVVTRNDRVMIIPNHKFMDDTLFNWTQNNSSNRESVSVGVAYGSDVRLVEKLLHQAVDSVEGIVKEGTVKVTFDDFADSSLNFSVHFYVIHGMQTPGIQSEIRFRINDLFAENNISIPFPQRDLNVISVPVNLASKKEKE
ncbi:mechanosensitive ion channel family protein [Flavobacterium sp. ABG]|uniref:mechanosensitive ion channel family protein n=1 Tax=Flavobacterium sp. ABG TaxID=1423322 RepID=UPI00064A7FDA|nr:mechanosensitive ion channel domain-containing protein [Flavobacterium sp. ABG]KLT67819.1 mechanosensitive ion channel protein MscS [Flavobacterium sp. ABG]